MTTKKQKLLICGLGVILFATVSGTSAFFVTSGSAHNVITTDGVAIELVINTEQSSVDVHSAPSMNIEGVQPGEIYSKIPQIKNVDNGDVYVRMRVYANVTHADGTINKISPSIFNLDLSRSWSYKDGYYYYLRTLHAGETTVPLFTTVTIPGKFKEEYKGATFSLSLTGEAVQAANNGDNALNAEGWPKK